MPNERLKRACVSLDGLSVGDAFGQQFFSPFVEAEARPGNLPNGPWQYTDDTEMAIALTQTLRDRQTVDQDYFAQLLAERHEADPYRGYGAGARELLTDISAGGDWRTLSKAMFGGTGSYGNGAAMRVAPLGVWFADDVDRTIQEAAASCEVTHAHPEGIVGGIAVALAAGWVSRRKKEPAEELIPWVISQIEASEVRKRLEWVATYPLDTWAYTVASQVGCGMEISAHDTVPFCLWMVAANIDNYSEAIWTAARVGGDRDTTCAIIGGILAASVGPDGIPEELLRNRETLEWSSGLQDY